MCGAHISDAISDPLIDWHDRFTAIWCEMGDHQYESITTTKYRAEEKKMENSISYKTLCVLKSPAYDIKQAKV